MSDDLVVAALEGDPHAIDALLRWVRPLVVRYCRARIGRQQQTFASADDVAQDVCLAMLTAMPTYRDQGKPFLAFVYGIAAHKVADAHRAAARNRSDPTAEFPDSPALTAGPEERAIQAELSERMADLLATLPEKQREIVVLRVVLGFSAEETAAAVGSTAGAVRVTQHRALGRLRQAVSTRAGAQQQTPGGETEESAAGPYPEPQLRSMITPTRYQRGEERTLGQ